MMSIDTTDTKRTFDAMEGGGGDQPSTGRRDGGGSRRRPSVEQATTTARATPTAQGVAPSHHRRVHFIDALVTSITFRPSTLEEDKSELYYSRQDYDAFFEDYYEVYQQPKKEVEWKFGYEDFLTADGNEFVDYIQAIDMSLTPLHKVKAFKDLQVS